jgi:hypothetical protein
MQVFFLKKKRSRILIFFLLVPPASVPPLLGQTQHDVAFFFPSLEILTFLSFFLYVLCCVYTSLPPHSFAPTTKPQKGNDKLTFGARPPQSNHKHDLKT